MFKLIENIIARKWIEFPDKLKSNLPFFVLISIFFAVIGFNESEHYWRKNTIVTFFMFLVSILIFVLIIIKSIPEVKQFTRTLINKNIDIIKIGHLYPKPKLIGIIGISNAGKSTLINKIRQSNNIPKRTTSNTCFIILDRNKHNSYLAILDGPGDNFPNQTEIIAKSDILILMVDHNLNESEIGVDNQRISKLTDYNFQYKNSIVKEGREIMQVHLLLNKKDQWDNNDDITVLELTNWFNAEAEKFRQVPLIKSVTFQFHSNYNQDCVNNLLKHIKI